MIFFFFSSPVLPLSFFPSFFSSMLQTMTPLPDSIFRRHLTFSHFFVFAHQYNLLSKIKNSSFSFICNQNPLSSQISVSLFHTQKSHIVSLLFQRLDFPSLFFFGFHFFVLFELVNMWIVKLRYLEMHKLLTFAHLVLASLMLKHFGFWGCLSLPFIVFCMFLKIFRNIHFLMHFCCFNDLVCWCLLIV